MSPPESGNFEEQMGDLFERMGQPRIAGRLFGYLLVCVPSEQSAAQIRDAIGASDGSVSMMLKLLRSAGFVEARGEAGGRRRWYRIGPGSFARVLAMRMRLVTELKNLAETGLKAIGEDSESAARLIEMRNCYAFFEREFPQLLERYEATVRPD